MVTIGTLNGGNITITTGSVLDATKTRFTLQDGTVEEYDITGTLGFAWLSANNFASEDFNEEEDCDVWTFHKNIVSLDIGNTVTSVEYYAFDETFSSKTLTNVTIPSSVTSIGESAFNNCENLTTITVLGKTTSEAEALLEYTGVPGNCTIVGELG